MKKKIRDLTIQEILDIHEDEDFEGCDNCPFDNTILCNLIHDKHQREYLDKEVEIKFDEKGNAKCPICNGDLEWHYNKCQILCYMCKCGFEYPVKKEQLKLWKYGEGWWNKWGSLGKKCRKEKKNGL